MEFNFSDLKIYSIEQIIYALEFCCRNKKHLPLKLARVIEAKDNADILLKLVPAVEKLNNAVKDVEAYKAKLIDKYGENFKDKFDKAERDLYNDKYIQAYELDRQLLKIKKAYEISTERLNIMLSAMAAIEKGATDND